MSGSRDQQFRLYVISAFSAVRQVDFRWWGITSALFWILSCAIGVVGSLNTVVELNVRFAVFVSIFGILASISSIFSITGIWNLIRVRHKFFKYLASRADQQAVLKAQLAIEIKNDRDGKEILEINTEALLQNASGLSRFFSFAEDDKKTYEFSILNSLAYYDNVFGQNPRKKFQRNQMISSRNGLSQLLLRRSHSEKYWAISALFPMTAEQWNGYLYSKKSDNDFQTDWLLETKDTAKIEAALIFSFGAISGIVGKKDFVDPIYGPISPGKLVLVGVFWHLATLLTQMTRKRTIDVYIAANDKPVIDVFHAFGFSSTLLSTGDDIPVFHARIRAV